MAVLPDELSRLALSSAVLPAEAGVAAWRRGLRITPLEDWPGTLARVLPQTYLNLRHEPNFTHATRMRGIYRAAWSSNMVKVNRLGQVTRTLESAGLDYRVIKGGAVCSWLSQWGTRRMGDIDLVLRSEDWSLAEEVLGSAGFTPRFPVRHGIPTGCWDDGQGGVIDVHVSSVGSPLRALIFASDARLGTGVAAGLRIPDPDVCLAIAVGHAIRGVAASDMVQGLLDLANLEPLVDVTRTADLLRDQDSLDDAERMFAELVDLGWRPTQEWTTALQSRRGTQRSPASATRRGRRRRIMTRGVEILRNRRVPPIRTLRRQPWMCRRPRYVTWLFLGQLRPLEARLLSRAPMMPIPGTVIALGVEQRVHFTERPSAGTGTVSWIAGRVDRRIGVRVPPNRPGRLTLIIPDEIEVKTRRLVFIDGRVHGYFPVDDAREATYELTSSSGLLEFSLRDPGGLSPEWCDEIGVQWH